MPCACRKVFAMPPPMISLSTLASRFVEHRDLGRDLGAADHRRGRPLRLVERGAQRVDLFHHQRSGIGRQQVRDALGRGVRAMGAGEGIADEHVAERGQLLGEGRIVLLLALVEAQVFQHRDARPAAWRRRPSPPPRRCNRRRRRPACRAARPSSAAIGVARLSVGSTPFGRPKCESTITLAPRLDEVLEARRPAAPGGSHRSPGRRRPAR